MDRIYKIEVEVPLGIRKGTMRLHICKKKITGKLELLGTLEEVEGEILEDGSIYLKGKLTSQIRKSEYTSTSKMKDNTIQLHMISGKSCYLLNGVLFDEKGEI